MTDDTRTKAGPRIAIIGGGQLAKMTALSALELGCDVLVLELKNEGPAVNLASHFFVGDWNNPDDLLKLAEHADVVTLENEFVLADSLAVLERDGHLLFPTSHTVALIQDKFVQKETMQAAGLPLPEFRAVESRDDIKAAADEFGWPLIIKARHYSYDGKGNATINSDSDIEDAWQKLDGDNRGLYVEALCPFVSELAIMITSGRSGEVATYPLVESVQRNHICHIVRAPAEVADDIRKKATDIARHAVAAIGAIGSFGVEMFLMDDGRVMINELAPRVHNSGHYTIEACECSQFENHVRAILGFPLGSTRMVKPAAVMINLLGSGDGSGYPRGIEKALAIPGAHVHIYGKEKSRSGRKMGHVTATGNSVAEAESTAQATANLIRFGV